MVFSTRTNCSLRWRVCMALRWDSRAANISETSKLESKAIGYLLRLMPVPSTENTKCGVLTPLQTSHLSTGSHHVALPKIVRAHNSLYRINSRDRRLFGPCGRPNRRLAGCRRRRQHPGCPVQRQHVGRGVLGEDPGRARQEQSRSGAAEPADAGHADPACHEEE